MKRVMAVEGVMGVEELPQNALPEFQLQNQKLQKMLQEKPIEGRARNVILFIGDGHGVTSMTASRIYAGQKAGGPGEEYIQNFERLPYSALVKTYNTNAQVPDSAGTATALLSGVKTSISVLGVNQNLEHGDCAAVSSNKVTSLAETAKQAGRATGVVTTTRITHATPAAAYAHSADRDWEASVPAECKGQKDIAAQLLDADIDIALGGGRRNFMPERRTDGRNLISEFTQSGGLYLDSARALRKLPVKPGQRVLGLFAESHLDFAATRDKRQPSLSKMTATAIKQLAQNPRGYFLLVEGGRIDHAHHGNSAYNALEDAREFDLSVKQAMDMTNPEDTLILVTADHSHVLVMQGYSIRGNPILGVCRREGGKVCEDKNNKNYTTLGYYNGPAGEKDTLYPSVTEEQATRPDYQQRALLLMDSETHGGEDVAVYARGPWAHLARGSVEQHFLYHLMRHAMGL